MLPILTSVAFKADERTMLEDAAMLRLMSLHKSSGGPVELVAPYNGELDTEEGMQQLAAKLLRSSPAFLVAAGESTFEPTDLRRLRYKERMTLYVLACSRHMRSPEARTRGDGAHLVDEKADPGIFSLMRSAKDRLVGWDLAIAGMERLQIVQENAVITSREFTIWRLLFRVLYAETQTPADRGFPSSVPIEAIETHLHHTDDDGDGVAKRDVVVTHIT